ncbi:MAG TPA: CHASE domain-containing protein [Duganella sp.]
MEVLLAQRQMFSPPKSVWWAGIMLSLGVGALCYVAAYKMVEYDAGERFMHQARNAQYHISSRIDTYTDVLRATASFFDASDRVDREAFHRFVGGLKLATQFPALVSINFAEFVTDAQREQFEKKSRQSGDGTPNGYPDYRIEPSGRRVDYSVITMIEPIAAFRWRVGLDITHKPAVAQALSTARNTGEVSTSGKQIDMDSFGQGGGMAIRLPLYRKDMPLTSIDERRAAYKGSVGIGFSVPRLVQLAMDQMQVRDVRLRLYDGGESADRLTAASPPALLFDNKLDGGEALRSADEFTVVLPLIFNGRQWRAHFSAPKAAWSSRFDLFLPWLAMTAGFVGSLLCYLLIHTLSSSRMRAIKMAKVMTKELRDSQAKLQQSHHKLRRLAAHADQIKEQERKRIAREIHDDLGQNLLALRIEADILASRTSLRHPHLNARANATLKQIDDTIRSVRNIINDLRPNVLDLGLSAAVEWQTTQFRKRSGIECDVLDPDGTPDVDDRCAVALFRVLQESLSNIQQHARATHVRVELRQLGGTLRMIIADNGIGLHDGSRNKNGSFGLVGIEERMSLLGGDCSIISRPHGGTTVTVTVPVAWRATQPAVGEFVN